MMSVLKSIYVIRTANDNTELTFQSGRIQFRNIELQKSDIQYVTLENYLAEHCILNIHTQYYAYSSFRAILLVFLYIHNPE